MSSSRKIPAEVRSASVTIVLAMMWLVFLTCRCSRRELFQPALRALGALLLELDAHAPYLDKVVKSGHHPLLARVIRDAELPHAADSAEHGFQLGLERLLDGWEANLPIRP
ncbi:hypothetical protein [Streptomyces sp. NPDC005209]|uniref:hypothetical protein n=1 Tax=Streptomyces sp. NPDC005209 TaxID=3156715 RepID=UPI0033B2AA86